MSRENWLWMQASVSLIAATAAALRRDVQEPKQVENSCPTNSNRPGRPAE